VNCTSKCSGSGARGASTTPAARSAERPNHFWALAYHFDQTADGRVLKLLNVVDEHTRESLAMVAARRSPPMRLEQVDLNRGTGPEYICCENDPELTAHALRNLCRMSGTGTSYIEPGAPWENLFVGSETNCSPSSNSTPCSKPRSSSRTGGSSATRGVPTAVLACWTLTGG